MHISKNLNIAAHGFNYRVRFYLTIYLSLFLYALTPFNFYDNYSFDILSYDLQRKTFMQYNSGFFERPRYGSFRANGGLNYDNLNNRYYVVNGYSTASYIDCISDQLNLQSGWNWVSFPRLERTANNYTPTIPVLERLSVFPCNLYMEYNLDISPEDWIEYYPPDETWDGYLENLQSTKGYKLDIQSPSYTISLPMHGAKLEQETEITLYPNQENWVGYFIDHPQMPFDCFDTEDWEHLTEIKTQYWTMIKTEDPYMWKLKGKVTPFEYGDLVVLRTDEPHTFKWIDTGIPAPTETVPQTAYYSFEEQADYLPIFVEFDENSTVQEIAVLAEGVVKGAAVREPGDELVEVNAYLEGVDPGVPLEFETWDGFKALPVEKTGYVVYNPRTKKKEKRPLFTGEAARYQLVSFKQDEIYEIPDGICEVSCVPNPFNQQTTISFRLNESMEVWVEIFDLNGKKVADLMQGELIGGYYNFTWKGENSAGNKMQKGVYFFKIRTGKGTEISDKIVLM
jgi:hypothetical protein